MISLSVHSLKFIRNESEVADLLGVLGEKTKLVASRIRVTALN